MGRPLKQIDTDAVLKLAQIGCTVEEIAAVLKCNKRTLERRFVATIKEGHDHLKASLRRMQWISAEKGNVTMQIWLGKQLLGQKDKSGLELSDPDGKPLGTSAISFYLPEKDPPPGDETPKEPNEA